MKVGIVMNNGYKILAQGYRKGLENGKLNREEVEKHCKVLDFLGDCDKEDICNMFDTSAFNEIAKSYMNKAIKELIEEDVINEQQGISIKDRYAVLLDELKASEIIE